MKRKRKAEKEAAAAPEIDMSAYGYAADDDPDNPANYHAPDEQSPFGAIARGEQVDNGLKISYLLGCNSYETFFECFSNICFNL